jgi:hypothetical protein
MTTSDKPSNWPTKDVSLVRELAARVRALASSDEYEARRQRWRDVNERRRPDRAPVWCRPAGVWPEIIADDALECTHPLCRQAELTLRRDLYKDWVGDDHIRAPWWNVGAVWQRDQEHTWGVPTHVSTGATDLGGFRYHHPIETPQDYERIRIPTFAYDREATERIASRMNDLLGEAMPVHITGSPPLGPHLSVYLEQLRGMGPMMEDMAFRPELVHRTMAKLTEAVLRAQRAAEDAGMLTTNHHEPMFCSDPLNDPPSEGPAQLHNLWVAANSQEFDQVSPPMQEEFLLSYQKVLFQQFGATQYGCCENLTTKTDIVLRIPNLRIFVSSFWTDLDTIIEACGKDYTIMWRQSSTQVTMPEDLEEHRRHLKAGLKRLQGHYYQVVLRELETLFGRPERLRDWAKLAIGIAEQYA